MQERIKELTAQVAWLNRQLFGRKSEKLRVYDPTIPDLFSEEFAGLRQEAEEKRDEAVKKIEKATCKAHDVTPRDYLNDVIAQMPYYKKATREQLSNLLPHKWKLKYPECVLTKQKEEFSN